jgi:alpha-tubulin suppressor-like RCC1 family protein
MIDGPAIDAPDSTDPDAPANACDIVALRLYGSHTCVVRGAGDTWCWGYNRFGEIGLPATSTGDDGSGCNPTPAPVPVPAARWLGMGDNHTCIGTTIGTMCWGRNVDFELSGTISADTLGPQVLVPWVEATEMTGGEKHMCALTATGGVFCAGSNSHGELGIGSTSPSRDPMAVSLPAMATQLSGGYNHNCALLADATVWCWGENGSGQTSPDRADHLVPVQIGGIAPALAIGTGYDHTCSLGDGIVTCWGANDTGQLGIGSSDPIDGTVEPLLVVETTQLAVGVGHACALGIDGQVRCWGETYGPSPTVVALGVIPARIAAGSYHDCAATADEVYCWRSNNYGQLGTGAQSAPVAVPVLALTCPQ